MSTIHSKKNLLKRTAKLEKELAAKGYALKVESALEKVSIAAMSMRRSKDLSGIGSLIFTELKKLGFTDLRNSEIIINNDAKETITSYYYSDYGVTGVIELDYKSNAIVKGWANQLKKASNAFAEVVIPEKEMKAWRKYREEIGYLPDRKLNKAKTVYYYSYSTGAGALSISSFKPVSKEQIKILKRFRNVFQLSYQRYIDIAKAEAQAREAQTEASLERVRASSMAMQQSNELHKVIKEVTDQLTLLGFDFDTSNITTNLTPAGFYVWNASPVTPIPSGVYIPYKDIDVINSIYADWGIHEGIKTDTFNKVQKNTFFKHYLTHTEGRNLPEERKKYILGAKSFNISSACRKEFALDIINYRNIIYTDEQNQILERFAKVFEQSYTRFLDLKRAEAQAREAQIEAALERVRSKAMAMHNSADMSSAASIVFTELRKLGINPIRSGVGLLSKEDHKAILYGATISEKGDDLSLVGWVMLVSHPIFAAQYEKWLLHEDYFPVLENEEIKKYYEKLSVNFSVPVTHSNEKQYGHFLMFTHGFLFCWSQRPYEETEIRILKRFASVIDLTFKRYFDLQKAETQAREAKIEAALERVRSRTMAMHNSQDVADTVAAMFDEFVKLGIETFRCGIGIIHPTKEMEVWTARPNASGKAELFTGRLDMTMHPLLQGAYSAWEHKEKFYTYELKEDDLVTYFTGINKNPNYSQKYDISSLPPRLIHSEFYFQEGTLFTFSLERLSAETSKIFKRFAAVFGQTYRRFLDLQNAEAQARESQIQLALERVRARTMAMQKSDELPETAAILFEQFKSLGQELMQMTIGIVNEADGVIEFSVTDWSGSGAGVKRAFNLSIEEPTLIKKLYTAWKENKKSIVVDLTGKELENWINYRNKMSGVTINSVDTSGRRVITGAFFSKGHLSFSTPVLPASESIQLLERFAQVFDLTYTRFLDLKKAEAQAREAQIELGLERVRARAMAMQTSEELNALIGIVFTELTKLDLVLTRCVIIIYDAETKGAQWWMANSEAPSAPMNFFVKYANLSFFNVYLEGWEKRDLKWQYILEGENKIITDNFLFNETELKTLPDFVIEGMKAPHKVYLNASFNNFGNLTLASLEPLSDEHFDILLRFAKVFDLTYTRFNDLKQAEAQAREAKIETALERVRARSMAMRQSDELHAVADVLFQQLRSFGGNIMNAGIALCTQDADEDEYWLSSDSGLRPVILIPHTEDPIQKKLYEDWKNKAEFYSIAKGGDELRAHYNYLRSVPHLKPFFEEGPGWSFPTWQKWHAAYFSHGYLFMITLEPYEEEKILVRFAKVFEQAYTRFLDLQKAEAQAREAQIEAALERVRSKAMAMHNSADLSSAASVVFTELKRLGIRTIRSGISLLNKDNRESLLYTAAITDKGENISLTGSAIQDDHPVRKEIYDRWIRGEDYFPVLKGDMLKSYYQSPGGKLYQLERRHQSEIEFPSRDYEQHGYFMAFTQGMFYGWAEKPFDDNEKNILKRFASVVDLTFKRYFDLQKAEANVREAQIETSLERVRSRTMAMHNSNDVGETVATMFAEFVHLGIHTNRCGILIFNDQHIAEVWTARSTPGGNAKLIIGKLDLDAHKMLRSLYNAWKSKETFYQYDLLDNDLVQYYTAINNSKFYPTQFDLNALPSKEFNSAFFFTDGGVFSFTNEPVAEEHAKIIKRFALVFGQTYRRYLDLQKAEAQARESQIQLSLERVRARTMAMHKSEELAEVAEVLYNQLKDLGDDPERITIGIMNEDNRVITWWATDQGGSKLNIRFQATADEPTVMLKLYNSWKAKHTSLVVDLTGPELSQWVKYCREVIGVPIHEEILQNRRVQTAGFFSHGCVMITSPHLPDAETIKILERFTTVFDLTFRRFLDLQKAEAQTREAQIEAGLERVRARTMAMHSSEDVSIATATMFTELEKLGIENFRGGITNLLTNRTQDVWSVTNLAEEKVLKAVGAFNIDAHPFWQLMFKEWEAKKDFLHYFLAGQEKEQYIKILNATQGYFPQAIEKFPDVNFQVYYFNEGAIWTNSLQPHSEEDKQVMKRFTSVFSLTFRRYQDLKKAEAQAKEAQIETSLERVRSKTMAMHSSDDVTSAIATMFTELDRLGIENMRCGIAHYLEDHKMEVWSVSNLADGKVVRGAGLLDTNSIPFWKIFYSTWQKKKDFLYYSMAGKEKEDYFKKISTLQNYLSQSIEDVPDLSIQTYYFPEGSVWAFSLKPHSEEDKQVMKRFASVFSLTFRRYQDLKKAEAQAREATIEAAMEKVRGKAMAMHNSNDLSVTASLVFTELRKLGINPIRCGVGLLNKESKKSQLYSATSSADGDSLSLVGWVILSEHPVLEKIYGSWLDDEEYYPQLQGEQMRSYYQLLLKGLPVTVPQVEDDKKQYGHFLPFSVGCLYAWSEAPYNEAEIKILKRFATIIDLTFRRYMELQTSEANAREAVKQAALDRVRAEIASMRTVADLDRITPLIWNELTILGLPFIRCGVFIMDSSQQLIHTFLSTPDGKAIGAFHLPYDTPGNFSVMLKHWLDKETYISRWDEVDFIGIAEILVQQGSIATREQYLSSLPKGGFYLHFLPFLQGMLYVGNTTQLGEEEIELIQHVADAFSTAYARYEDFNKLEAAKQQVEKTLTDLKQAQTQLVQSEKMASLGELTAGIAHEIQNPLNFVNNFSDVSNELLDEMKMELEKGNHEDALAIAKDVKQNLEKINHHGKRADSIVKGMLQHSRTSSGQKEMTDINALADEYLRLAYHGLRAKEKSFNAKFETDFDKNVGEINIIPQDIGRVILNLINNAFYAVSERQKVKGVGYEPTVVISTASIQPPLGGRSVQIKVTDNGGGIPQKVIDKIFQPFFTTKPTGQGTGLGLSLAYDIIKAHGGDIKVETKEGEGSEFTIQLPTST